MSMYPSPYLSVYIYIDIQTSTLDALSFEATVAMQGCAGGSLGALASATAQAEMNFSLGFYRGLQGCTGYVGIYGRRCSAFIRFQVLRV